MPQSTRTSAESLTETGTPLADGEVLFPPRSHDDGRHAICRDSDRPELPKMRSPMVPLAISFAVGITCDRFASPSPGAWWGLAGWLVLLGLMLTAARQRRMAALCLLGIVAVSGAIHHHATWFARTEHDIERILGDDRRLIRLRGHVVDFPVAVLRASLPASAGPQRFSTRFLVNTTEAETSRGWQVVSGRLQVHVAGSGMRLAPGDAIDVTGFAQRCPVPNNPGTTDYRHYLWSQGVRGMLRVRNAELVRGPLERRAWWNELRYRLRMRCDQTLREHLRDDSLAIGLAFLLGDRSLLPRHVNNAFIQTGTMHILAISGVHVTLLASFVIAFCKGSGFCDRFTAIAVLLISLCYLFVADVRPPMVRAFVLTMLFSLALLFRRPVLSFNSMAFSALFVMLWNPTDLFDIGTQLSFLAVAVIVWWGAFVLRLNSAAAEAREPEPRVLVPAWKRRLRLAWRWTGHAYALTAAIWVITTPLVVSTFHVISPIGLLVNVPLVPIATPALWVGFLFLLAGLFFPALAAPLGVLFDWLLQSMLLCVEAAASLPHSHLYAPAPPAWWLIVMYGGFGGVMLAQTYRRRRSWIFPGVIVWLLFGASLMLRAGSQSELRLTVLHVGHGLCTVVESPAGRVLVYDVGCSGDGELPRRVLAETLWSRQRSSIDTIVISHADADHYNGLLGILDTFHVRRVIVAPQMLTTNEPGARAVLLRVKELGICIETASAMQRIDLDRDVDIQVLHPRSGTRYETDNAMSLVLEFKYRDRRLVLTGDVEGQGIRELISTTQQPTDVFLAPHHGSLKDNPPELVTWAEPRWVVASSGLNARLAPLQARYGPQARVLTTSQHGAIEFVVSDQGELSCQVYAGGMPTEIPELDTIDADR